MTPTDNIIIFLGGPSGVGKSYVADLLIQTLNLHHVDIDIRRPFHTHSLQKQWHLFSTNLILEPLVSALNHLSSATHAKGVLLTFPSTRILTPAQIDAAESVGICTAILWGPEELCKTARIKRDQSNGLTFDENRYDKRAVKIYSGPDYAEVRLNAFRPDGPRWPRECIVELIRRRLVQDTPSNRFLSYKTR